MQQLDQKVEGKDMMQFMADLLEKNEKQEIEIERGKLSVSILKQMNNYSRLKLDAEKFELKKAESGLLNIGE
ncbi:hypothetical protein LK429_00420 [Hoylesella buccalis]|uniref:hypothetical protein n=1 Tax=Hoylesella buccalis TaxID=28127 RepID=UPI001D13F80C|nr:hypothetical protein [Hoylesella buccalis]UEA63090.1 hypothetical protein LK429_00420 [Hoylesella buccalis]UWP49620.1 hypothetical protein NQ518_00695 [Hoylesella buccalis ATCC 35310]